jgi:glycosyltransferase involved in cell wall biosynthesis
VTHEVGIFSVDAVFRSLDRTVARRLVTSAPFSAIYAYEDCAESSFAAAHAAGMSTIYDLPIGYWRAAQKVFEEEAEREPEWACTLTGRLDSDSKRQRKDSELEQSDGIIVASQFTKSTLAEAPRRPESVFVVPYGAPPVAPYERPLTSARKPLRVMYAGALTQRKGLSYFLAACDTVRNAIEVTILGRRAANKCTPLDEALRKYRYIESLPHRQLLAEMAQQDVLVFPSLFEGFGLVILEAMAQGVPVITTPSTAGPDLITEAESGFIVPTRDSSSIVAHLELLNSNRQLLRDMAMAARAKAGSSGWGKYRQDLVAAVLSVIESKDTPRRTCVAAVPLP